MISEELRALSCERKIPIISAIQSNRASSNGKSGYPGEDMDLKNVSESSRYFRHCGRHYPGCLGRSRSGSPEDDHRIQPLSEKS